MNRTVITPTPFGSIALVWSRIDDSPRIAHVLLSTPGFPAEDCVRILYPDSGESSCEEIDAVGREIRAFLGGEDITFPLAVMDMSRCTPFQGIVLCAEHRIPRGRISTYRLIACHLGRESGSRAVGNALARNPFPILIPCHRAIRSDRSPGGFQGGLEMKRRLLEMEGIEFDEGGRVENSHFFYG
ncbi:MAG: methylated-DNA--[protein]-cysteine S-methyltransferase [Methanolinea sp.]|nr:methylated-DNA--[protein]-cysteine S-methyltransferase [Methanolinea sp.]